VGREDFNYYSIKNEAVKFQIPPLICPGLSTGFYSRKKSAQASKFQLFRFLPYTCTAVENRLRATSYELRADFACSLKLKA
jgi:hypothetical protein